MASKGAAYQPGALRASAPDGLAIRRANPSDCADVGAIAHERDGVPLPDATLRCERDVANQDRLLLIARVDGELAAFGRSARWQPTASAPANVAPTGWYLFGVIVRDRWRRRGIAMELTRRRLAWISERANEAYYFANSRNRVSIELHAKLGFVEVSRDFTFPGASFEDGEGILFRADLASPR
jgi:ribosomal protein S18 acetylase RimI-like enzyme